MLEAAHEHLTPEARNQLHLSLARRLVERNLMVYRHQWIIILSGVFEPIFYLVGIGLGLGGLIDTVPLPDGREAPLREALALWRGPALSDFAYDASWPATVASIVCGVALIALNVRRGPIRHSYGGWSKVIV